MNSQTQDPHLGEYQLLELLDETASSRKWLARQISVSRTVLIDELKSESHRDAFLSDVRAKASIDHPLIGSIYEAVNSPELCFFAHELLPGTSLEARRHAAGVIEPTQLVPILRRVAEANLQHEALNHATTLLDLDSIFLDEHGVVRLSNLVIAGPRSKLHSARDIGQLGSALRHLIPEGKMGSTRMLTLCAWMRGEGLEAAIGWNKVRDFCEQIEQQFTEEPLPNAAPEALPLPERKVSLRWLFITAAVLAVIAAAAVTLRQRPAAPTVAARLKLPPPVKIDAGSYLTPDGKSQDLPAFRIAAQPVTIGDYSEFIDTLTTLAKNHSERTYDSKNQLAGKLNHRPDDWENLLAAAKAGLTWNGQQVTLDSAIVGVDWWDAAAFAEWKKARLPSQEEWLAALPKITTNRSIREWTLRPAINPENPLGERLWVLISPTNSPAANSSISREWIADSSLRRSNLSFRLLFETP
jgi:formylglycine-generating enzyme required for sulfatase activity